MSRQFLDTTLGDGFAGLHLATHVDTETNYLDGFCFFHHHGLNSRRYQELPIAATRPAIGRFLPSLQLEERLIVDEACVISQTVAVQ